MKRPKLLLPFALAAVLLASPASHAAYVPNEEDFEFADDSNTAPAMVFDLVLVRPLGVVATLVGTTFFILGLPFEAATQDFATPRHYLVEEPARFTFQRPLGDFED